MTTRRLGAGFLVGGMAGLGVSFWGLSRDVGFIAQPFYAYAWWSYIFILDGFVALKRGDSLFTTRRQYVFPLLVWSITFWYFFELLNLRFQNWYYVGVFAVNSVKAALFGVACFATVFTGLFETYEAVTALGLFRRLKIRRRAFPPWTSFGIQGLGAVMVLLSLLFPYYLAPLVWGSVTFLLDPWNYRRGARSILGDLERGELDILARMLVAGLLCGLVWETFNFFAPQKWIYTVRGLEQLKLFEMPLLGFLGFPALAADAFAAFSTISYCFHGNVTWENPKDVAEPALARRPLSRPIFVALLPLHFVFWGAITYFTQTVNIGSVQLELEQLETLPPRCVAILSDRGIERPRQLLEIKDDADRRSTLQEALGLSGEELEEVLQEVRLFTFKGIGHHHGKLLHRAGIRRLEELAEAEPEALHDTLQRLRCGERFPALRLTMVRVWVFAARSTEVLTARLSP